MSFKFDSSTFETVQNLLYPVILSLTGFDTSAWVGEQSQLLVNVGDALGDLSALFVLAGTALEDGKITAAELDAIIAQAKTLPEAIDEISGFFGEPEPSE